MKKRKMSLSVLLFVLVIAGFFGKGFLPFELPTENYEGKLAVSFIDVGQGDSTFISFPGGKTMLIDSGERESGETVCTYIKGRNYDKIDYVVATHPHSDHIGGMQEVIENIPVGEVYMPRALHTSKTYENLLKTIQTQGKTIKTAVLGKTIPIEEGITATFLAPRAREYEDLNNYSAVLRITYGNTAFLFMGDAEILSEEEILSSRIPLTAQVLKVGHHGSSTSSSEQFLEMVSPQFAVISCGEGNSYGHPHKEVLKALKKRGITVYRTDKQGTVTAVSDGETITFTEGKSLYDLFC